MDIFLKKWENVRKKLKINYDEKKMNDEQHIRQQSLHFDRWKGFMFYLVYN